MSTRPLILAIVIVTLVPLGVAAEEPVAPATGYVSLLAAGALVVNSGMAVANGISLSSGTSSRRNGVFGLVLGTTTVAVSAVSLAIADDQQTQDFSLLLGAAGMASALTGMLSIKFAGQSGDRVSVAPLVDPFASKHQTKAGLQLKIRF